MRKVLELGALALMAAHLSAQTAPEFDVAVIKPSEPSTDGRTHTRISSDTSTGQLHYGNVSLKELLGQAYELQQYQIYGPGSIDTEHFDIVAKFPPKSAPAQVPLMLQSLLKDRFKLAFHSETKELPVYLLAVGKNGPKFQATETASGITSNSNRTSWHIVAKVSMRRFAEFLTAQAGRPVLDKTGLEGSYELKLDWATNDTAATDAGPSLVTALQEQLGLKLESAKAPIETIVVDHIESVPTEN